MNYKPSEQKFTLNVRPRDWQIKAAKLVKAFKILCISTKRGDGKTVFGATHTIHQAFSMDRDIPCQFAIIAHTRNNAKQIAKPIIDAILGIHLGNEIKFDEHSFSYKFPNGNVIMLAGLDDIEAVRGHHLNGVFVDNAEYVDEAHLLQIIRPSLYHRNGFLILAGTEDARGYFSSLCDKGRNANESNLITLTV